MRRTSTPAMIAFVGWNGTWKRSIKKDQIRIRVAHWSGFGENGRNCMENLYYWLQTVDQLAISISIGTEMLGFVLEEG